MGATRSASIEVSSNSFQNGDEIPREFTCEGDNKNPHLQIGKLPGKTKSLALVVQDPDAPSGLFTHWMVWNIDPVNEIEEDSIPGEQGENDFGAIRYSGPCPASGRHRYFFRVIALDEKLDLDPGARRPDLEAAMEGHILATGQIIGYYERLRAIPEDE